MSAAPAIQPRQPSGPVRSRLLHLLAWATALSMFPLIWMGGLVTSKGVGMSVPDWPATYGHNMFVVPFDVWLGADAGGIFYEHTHRLLGSLAGFLAIGACVVAWWREPRRWVAWLATVVLLAVCVQGVLGGLRVVWVDLNLAVAHGILGQLTFAAACSLVVVTGRWWSRASTGTDASAWTRLLVPAGVAVIVAQLAVASVMRHYEAGLAVPDFPLSYGRFVPPVDAAGMDAANAIRVFDYRLEPTTLDKVWLHTAHRVGAVVVTGVLAWMLLALWKTRRLRGHAAAVGALLALQVGLGIFTVWSQRAVDVATAHVAGGALLLSACTLLAWRYGRVFGYARSPAVVSEIVGVTVPARRSQPTRLATRPVPA